MAVTTEELIERLNQLPHGANLYWYSNNERVILQAEWHEGELRDLGTATVASFAAFKTGGPVE